MKIHWPDGLDTDGFLRNYWQRKPLLIRNALPQFSNPLDPDELAGLACEEDAQARFIERQQNGEWRMCWGPFEESFFTDLSHSDWSLLLSDVEKLLPDFRDWLQPFRFLPDWRIDDLMISYAPEGSSVGAHVDQYDVFLLQSSGLRDWQIETSRREHRQSEAAGGIALLADFAADQSWQLQAGDMLYLPPGFAHHGIAASDACMTWSIGFRAPTAAELLPALWPRFGDAMAAQLRFQDAGRTAVKKPGQIDAGELQKLRELLQHALQQEPDTVDRWIATALTRTDDDPVNPPDYTETNTGNRALAELATLTLNSRARYLYRQISAGTAELFIANKHYECSLPLAEAICNQHLIGPELLKCLDNRDSELVHYLQQLDLLQTHESSCH